MIATLLLLALSQDAALELGSPFGDHMVLQRETDAAIWGWALPGETVSVETSWDGRWTVTRAGVDGRWRTRLTTPEAGGPFRIDVASDSGARLSLADVLIGEVWICSGQSNMEWPMTAIDDSAFELERSDLPRVRLFDVAHQIDLEPRDRCEGEWVVSTPETAKGFSAVGLLFGRMLHEELGVPIGLIGTNWGGTPAEAWTGEGTLRELFPEFDPILDRVSAARANPGGEESLETLRSRFWERVEAGAAAGGWIEASFRPEGWKTARLPGAWEEIELGGFDGCLWYQREVELDAARAGADHLLELGPIDDMDLVWFNGELVGASRGDGVWTTPRRYEVPGALVRADRNAIVLCAVDTGGAGRVGDAALGMRLSSAGAEPVDLAGEWSYLVGASLAELGGWPRSDWFHQNSPTSLSNGMLDPLIPYAMRGAIWYQGESNRPRAAQYRRLFPALISDWRERWDQGDFPFYFVQIAPFDYGGDRGEAAELREAQMLAQSLPNTGMAVTMDVGNPRDIHPRNKQDVAHRLALLALAETYGRDDLVARGPSYARMTIEGSSVRLAFDHAAGLTSGDEPPRTFTIAGEDRVFHPATARIDGESVIVSADEVKEPVAVRFAWGAADEPNLWNGAGLPSSSFRTDTWPMASAER